MTPRRIAFALGRLTGHNAHGAGFLHAALTHGIDPEVISCTSGQVYWVYQFLLCRDGRQGPLRELLWQENTNAHPFRNLGLNWRHLPAFGWSPPAGLSRASVTRADGP